MKLHGEKIAMLTAYDYSMASLLESTKIDVVLVGDSAANVMEGHKTTLPITLDEMIVYATSVVRAIKRALVVVDMPFGTYQGNSKQALASAIRIMKETGADAIKMEGGEEILESIQRILSAGIPVMGHLGLTPQSINKFGTYAVRATEQEEAEQVEKPVTEIVRAMNNMARKKIGALIVIERVTGLGDVIETGTRVDAEISAPLIENIFEPNTPLHDGAMIIRNRRINAAACILPLSSDPSISKELGTRHRAAIGITETTDAVSLIVSEETGIISMAREGRLTRHLDARSLNILLTELFTPERNMYSWLSTLRREEQEDEE
jgi:uncharacterized protein (TIGR00159 family)